MQNTSRVPAQLCKADKAKVIQNNDIEHTQMQGLRSRHLKRTLDIKDRSKRIIKRLPIRGETMSNKVKEVGIANEYVISVYYKTLFTSHSAQLIRGRIL